VAYRSVVSAEETHLEAWLEAITVGKVLPRMPLWVESDLCLPLELEQSYQATCEALRIGG